MPNGAETAYDASEIADYNDSEISPDEWNKMLMHSSAFKEWADPAEDVYIWEDGVPIDRTGFQKQNQVNSES